ncbi:MAG: hypothetical protein GY754_35925 [bacterium]|nr:hypothetical protein [bacterium]
MNYTKWVSGFKNLEELFAWVTNSPYFSIEPYLDQNPTNKKRLVQRNTMREFLNYIEENNITKTFQFRENREKELDFFFIR